MRVLRIELKQQAEWTLVARRPNSVCVIRRRRVVMAIWRKLGGSCVKEKLTRVIQRQPDDSSRKEIVRELAFHVMVERGLTDSDAKRTISNEEMAHRIGAWQQ